jgi:hypothetical protein
MASKDAESENGADVSSVRDAAKWLVTAFAAVGAALLGGIQFSELGALKDGSLTLGIGGFLLGLAGVGLAIWWTSTVLVTRIVSVTALRTDQEAVRFLDSHPDIVGQEYRSFDAFMNAREVAWRDWTAGRPANVSDLEWNQLSAARKSRLEHLEQVATRVARIWRFEKICRTFTEARGAAFVGAGMAAIGVLLFTYATQAKDQSHFAKSPSAVAVTYKFSSEGYQSLLEQMTKDCLPAAGAATLLDGWPKGSDVLIVSDPAKCPPLRLRWDESLGTLRATQTDATPSAKSP